ncbi:MAG: 23S rRNA (adenine(2503)-C(2))-methyltransferase RlmN [Candidatus Omnitrophica bacterium]|nr:23S rRNA (adenine(2503)-C(2))-methyltransferase RlmN [Candidatus Omnitrophota bacterium]
MGDFKTDIRDFTLKELKDKMVSMGQPAHRGAQIFKWLYDKNAMSFKEMTDLPKTLIAELERKFTAAGPVCEERLISRDGTEKFLWMFSDGEFAESVLIKGVSGPGKATICLSTQIGCKFKCPFCASGERSFVRNLTAGEIAGQISSAQNLSGGKKVSNVVFMGMGEPLDNYDNVVKAVRIMNDPAGLGIGARKITISTCGVVPGIRRLKDLGIQVELSVSLHASKDELRNKLAPVNRKYPIKELVKALEEYRSATGRVVTLEYTVMKGVNDGPDDVKGLKEISSRLKSKVNLISCNPGVSPGGSRPDTENVKVFAAKLRTLGVPVTLRMSRGDDIMAACGQLAARRKS